MKQDNFYKFQSLQTCNWDSPNQNNRKYRQVFDKWEVKYIGVELTIYNKKFDEEDWSETVTFKAYTVKKGRKQDELCCIEEQVVVKSDENIFVTSKGWGNEEPGKGWNKGEYLWEAYIGNKLVGTTTFYVEDAGLVDDKSNPYFDILSFKVYEGPDEGLPEEERVYLRKFDAGKTRYVFAELRFVNQLRTPWKCELFFNIYDDTRQQIARITFFETVESQSLNDDVITITEGWGSQDLPNWREDDYTFELEFQEQVIAIVPFTIGNSDQEFVASEKIAGAGTANPGKDEIDDIVARVLREAAEAEEIEDAEPVPEESDELEQSLEELEKLIGLQEIKQQIKEHISYLDFLQVRKKMGIPEEEELLLHSVFTGNPGTGKTTVVKLLGKIYKAMGLLSQGHVHIVESSDLVTGYIRQTGKTTKDEIEKARGGILFIDEAYMLYRKGVDNDFGSEAIAALITEMSDGEGDLAVMVAGYPVEMEEMIGSNPGMKSRFKHYFHFDDYTPSELMQIADFAAEKKKVVFSPEARKALEVGIMRSYRQRDRTFGNARFVHSLVDEAKINMGVRVMKTLQPDQADPELFSRIEAQDVKDLFGSTRKSNVDIPPDEEILADTMNELDKLVGIQNIKSEIRNIIKLVRYYREIGKDIRRAFPVHTVFTGNPGTGKTTLARIMGNLYKSLGILERGHLVETDASDLIAGYLGQTALKTKDKINEAAGGVLFIDEAYSLMDGQHPDFGKKAIETLIKQMDDRRGEFAVIVAGYPKPMSQFLESNPGIQSRFDQTFEFHDFSEAELETIALQMLAGAELVLEPQAAAHLKSYLAYLYQNRNQFFGNARSVRKIIDRAIIKQNLRMASMDPNDRTEEMMHQVLMEDLSEFTMDGHPAGRGIGFKPNH